MKARRERTVPANEMMAVSPLRKVSQSMRWRVNTTHKKRKNSDSNEVMVGLTQRNVDILEYAW